MPAKAAQIVAMLNSKPTKVFLTVVVLATTLGCQTPRYNLKDSTATGIGPGVAAAEVQIIEVSQTKYGFSWSAEVRDSKYSCTSDAAFVWPICGKAK